MSRQRISVVVAFFVLAGCEARKAPSGSDSSPPAPAATPAAAAPGAEVVRSAASPAPSAADPQRVKLPSGLEYEVLQPGEGASPLIGARVLAKYAGWLPDGRLFIDRRARPVELKLDRLHLIEGWVESLLAMKKGEKRKLKVPSDLGYGRTGYAGTVPPEADLEFELELVAFESPPPAR